MSKIKLDIRSVFYFPYKMGKFKFGSTDHLDHMDIISEDQSIKTKSLDRTTVFKKIMDKQKASTSRTIDTDEKMAEELMNQFIKILKERNELRLHIDSKNADLLSISQDLVSMTM